MYVTMSAGFMAWILLGAGLPNWHAIHYYGYNQLGENGLYFRLLTRSFVVMPRFNIHCRTEKKKVNIWSVRRCSLICVCSLDDTMILHLSKSLVGDKNMR
jgi:hypothetical protein